MNKTVVAVILIGIVTVGSFVVLYPYLFPDSTVMTVTFYNADGDKVFEMSTNPTLWVPWSFINDQGAEIDHVTVTISYEVVSSESLSTLSVRSDLTITTSITEYDRDHTPTVVIINTLNSRRDFATFELSRTFDVTYTMSELIPDVTPSGETNGWDISFELILEAVGIPVSGGANLVDTDEIGLTSEIGWIDNVVPTFTIIGTIST